MPLDSADEPLLLGLDVGTSRIKALVLDRQGGEVASVSATTPFSAPSDFTEMPVPALHAAVAEVLGHLADVLERVEAVAIAGLAESGAALDVRGRPLAPVIAWHDPRGAEVVDRLHERFGDQLDLAIGQRLRTVSSVAKLGWLIDHGIGGIDAWLGVPELLVHRFSGEYATDHSLAARTGCYDVGESRWMDEVASAAGFASSVLPRVEPAGTLLGRVSAEGSAWSGIRSGVPVALAGHDHLAGIVGCGAGSPDLVNSVGTAETVVGRSETLPDVARALDLRAAVTLQPDGRGWAVLASAARAGRVLGEAARLLGRPPEELDELAAGGTAPFDAGELLAGLQRGDDVPVPPAEPGAVWLGLLQALSQRTMGAVSRVVELLGPAPRLVVFGGGAASAPWLSAKAAAVELDLWRSTAREAPARGAALTAGAAAGWWPSPRTGPAPGLEPVKSDGRRTPAPPRPGPGG